MKDFKNLKHFEIIKINCSIEYARIKASRYNKKTGESIRIKSIDEEPYAYRDFFDIKQITGYSIIKIKEQLSEALEKIQIVE